MPHAQINGTEIFYRSRRHGLGRASFCMAGWASITPICIRGSIH